MSSGSHNFHTRHIYGGKVPVFDTCIHIWGKTGLRCTNEPTKNGQHCIKCSEYLMTFKDPTPASPAHTKPIDWHNEGATRKNRRKQAA